MRSKFLALALALVASGAAVQAHQVDTEIDMNGGVVVTLAAGQTPLAGVAYRVYGPEPGPPFATGVTARNGTLAFKPDRAGMWRVIATGEDGHGAVLAIEVGPDSAATAEGIGTRDLPRSAMVLAGVGYLLGIGGLFAYWRARS